MGGAAVEGRHTGYALVAVVDVRLPQQDYTERTLNYHKTVGAVKQSHQPQ